MLMEVVLLLLLIETLFKSLFLLLSLPLSLPHPPPVLSTTIYMPHPSIMIVRGRERCGQKKLQIFFNGLSLLSNFSTLSPPSLSPSLTLSAPPPLPEVDPFAPLSLQLYFHGCISRGDAELCVREDGEFLVRESTKKPGQFVLTGKANGKPQHLLLIDKNGRVSVGGAGGGVW